MLEFLSVSADRLVSAVIIWHLLIFSGYSVKVAPEQAVPFQRMNFGNVLELLTPPHRTHADGSVEWWIASRGTSKDNVLGLWVSLTKEAFAAGDDVPCLVFLDQAEFLALAKQGTRSHFANRAASKLTAFFSSLPANMGLFCTGTLNLITDLPAEQYTLLYVCSLAALAPLSPDAAKLAMTQFNGTQYKDDVFRQIWLFCGGVPRLLEHAFSSTGEKATISVALNEMTKCFNESYKSAQLFLSHPKTALSLVLCSAVRWKVTESGPHGTVPGTSTSWSDIFHAGAAFPDHDSVVVPRVWWCKDPEVCKQLNKSLTAWNIDLNLLVPDAVQLVGSSSGGPTARGVLWEELVAHSLAARFLLYCIQHNLDPSKTWAPFLEIYPTDDQHLRKVLGPFEVCWSKGIEYPEHLQSQATVSDNVGSAIRSNARLQTAHHDLLIPVRRDGTQLEYIAAQCRYGGQKGAYDLTQSWQDKTRKPKRNETLLDMPNVLLQICSNAEGYQAFEEGTPWAKRQDELRYSLMSCRRIISQLDVLLVL
ncbi:unnamed protein product [Symbiodinium sp. KB8]|nr:unnamed protein product [Symbiodinium sp. KB8]